jgi:hypothetical protein
VPFTAIAADRFAVRALFNAWNALSNIKSPSARVLSVIQELRQTLSGMGFLIEEGALKPISSSTNGRSPRQTP